MKRISITIIIHYYTPESKKSSPESESSQWKWFGALKVYKTHPCSVLFFVYMTKPNKLITYVSECPQFRIKTVFFCSRWWRRMRVLFRFFLIILKKKEHVKLDLSSSFSRGPMAPRLVLHMRIEFRPLTQMPAYFFFDFQHFRIVISFHWFDRSRSSYFKRAGLGFFLVMCASSDPQLSRERFLSGRGGFVGILWRKYWNFVAVSCIFQVTQV